MTMRFFTDDDFQFGIEMVLGGAYRQNTDIGESLATAQRIADGDADAWIREWIATADGAWGAGETARHVGRRITALSFYRRAATYYSTALYCTAKAKDFSAERELATWRRHRDCWEHVVDLSPVAGERLEIPYEGTTLKGYFFPAPDAQPGERRPLVIMNNGSDGATSAMWGHGGAAAGEHGYHWMTFDGPGQQYALYEQGIPFRPDWEAVLTPVVDAMVARADVDSDRMAVIGISQGGFWVPRALAFEHRLAAAVADGGVIDIARSWYAPLPAPLRELFETGQKEAFDATVRKGEAANPAGAAALEFRGRPYGITSGSRYDLFKAVSAYRLGEEVNDITTPMLVCDPDDDQFLPGQSRELYDRLPGEKRLVHFTAEEGASRHCEPMGLAVRDARIFDWLEGYLGA
jgi:Prolyl oligopeptidase family